MNVRLLERTNLLEKLQTNEQKWEHLRSLRTLVVVSLRQK